MILVAESMGQRTAWLSALGEIAGAAALRNVSKATIDALVGAGCRSVEEVVALSGRKKRALPAAAAEIVAYVAVKRCDAATAASSSHGG